MKIRSQILTAVVLVLISTNACFGFDDKGFQYWAVTKASLDINKEWKAVFEEEFKLGDDGGNLYYRHSDIGFVYKGLADWVDLGLNFRHAYEKDSKDRWKQENRPHFNITFKGKMFGLNVTDRSRLEYRDRENRDDMWRYRNKFTIKFPTELTKLKLRPYIADEIFINLDHEDLNRNRLYAGVSFDLSEDMTAGLYYMWQSSRSSSGEWNDVYVLGTSLTFAF